MKALLDFFSVMETEKPKTLYLGLLSYGVVLDFIPTDDQISFLKSIHHPLKVTTLFTVEERKNAPIEELLLKQVLHYVEVYGLNEPGLFNLFPEGETVTTFRFIRGCPREKISQKLKTIAYANSPVKDVDTLKSLLGDYVPDLEFSKIRNNELKIHLYKEGAKFASGDDAVRYICFRATGSSLLIKSKEVLSAIKLVKISPDFLEAHKDLLAEVFNRHKDIILSCKNTSTKTIINKIARLSKTKHVPIQEPISKSFISKAFNGSINVFTELKGISLRDKFKYLNLLDYKLQQSKLDAFVIRNGKVHIEPNREVYDKTAIYYIQSVILDSIGEDLKHLKDKNILLDSVVHYGLPISRKQVLGKLPVGTKIHIESENISAGIYWENSWGAIDLDLSSIDDKGNRIGWGCYSGYANTGITYSGDVTYAAEGAMEFFVSNKNTYGLFVNVFSGELPSTMELVIGSQRDGKWITDIAVREKYETKSKEIILGFVKNKSFVVYPFRLSNKSVSTENPVLTKAKGDFWTVNELFTVLGINYDTEDKGVKYDHELSYNSMSYDKLEALLLNK